MGLRRMLSAPVASAIARALAVHGVGGLDDRLDAGAADALHEQRRDLDRRAGIEPDVARQHVGVEAGLRDGAGGDEADLLAP